MTVFIRSNKSKLFGFFSFSLFCAAVLFFGTTNNAYGATRTIANGGGNYNTTSTWVEGVVPTSVDDVVATVTSGQLTVNAVSAAKSINFTAYTNTLTMNALLTVSGSVTLVSAMTISGTSGLTVDTTATLTSNTKVWPNALIIGQNASGFTWTLADDWTVSGSLTVITGNGQAILNGFTIYVGGSLDSPVNVGTISGTTNIVLNGTGTWSQGNYNGASNTGYQNNITINTSGTITISGAVGVGSLTYIAGTVVTTGSTLSIGLSTTLNTNGIIWNDVNLNVRASTLTLTSDLTLSGTLTIGGTGSAHTMTINGSAIHVTGSLHSVLTSGAVSTITGTSPIFLEGSGTFSGSSSVWQIKNNLTINTTGTITISGWVGYNTGILTYTAGTVVTTGSTLAIAAATTLATNGIAWNNVTFSGTSSHLLVSNFTANGTTTVSGVTTLGGPGSLVFGATSTWTGSSAMTMASGLTLGSAMTNAYTGGITFNATSGIKTITSNGTQLLSNVTFNGVGGTWQLGDNVNVTSTATVTLTNGTFDANNHNVSMGFFSSSNSNTRAITMGSGTWTLTGSSGTPWDSATTTGLTLSPGSSTVAFANISSSDKTFAGGGLTYNNFWNNTSSTGAVILTGSNTFNDFKIDAGRTQKFSANTTTTITTMNASGTVGNVITLTSSGAGLHSLVKSGAGTIQSDYLSISSSTASPANTWYARIHSVDGGSNSGWIFQQNLTLTFAGAGSGSVTSSPSGIACTSNCTGIFDRGTLVTLTGTPSVSSTFSAFSGDAGCSSGSFTIGSVDIACTATFAKKTFVLSVSVFGNGAGTLSSIDGGISLSYAATPTTVSTNPIDYGSSTILTSIPGSSAGTIALFVDCIDQGGTYAGVGSNNVTCTFSNITATSSILASFLIPGIVSTGGGGGTPSATSTATSSVSIGSGGVSSDINIGSAIRNPSPAFPNSTYKFLKNLRLGMTDKDVFEFQKYLNKNGFLVAATGPGSHGNETTKFGALTYKAVIRFQEFYKNEILFPAGVPSGKGTGFIGPFTRAHINGRL